MEKLFFSKHRRCINIVVHYFAQSSHKKNILFSLKQRLNFTGHGLNNDVDVSAHSKPLKMFGHTSKSIPYVHSC